jgi:hypothetical protein
MDNSSEKDLEELELFEGVSSSGRRTSRRLSAEDIESLQKGDGKYKRSPSLLRDLMQAGSLQSLANEEIVKADSTKDEPSAGSTPRKGRKPGRRVSWDRSVHVFSHPMVLGYNISVSSGPPVEIDWQKAEYKQQEVNEKYSKPTRQMKIPAAKRMRICSEAGHTAMDIMQRIEAVDILRQQHAYSVRKAKAEDRKMMLKAKKEAAKKRRKEQGGCCIIQ